VLDLMEGLGRIVPFLDIWQLASYTSDAGLSQEVEAQRVRQSLDASVFNELYGFHTDIQNQESNLPDKPDPKDANLPDLIAQPFADPSRLPDPLGEPLQEVTVEAPFPIHEVVISARPSALAPFVSTFPNGMQLIQPFGIPGIQPGYGTAPRPSTRPGASVRPDYDRPLAPRLASPFSFSPEPIFQRFPQPGTNPETEPQARYGEPINQDDCAPSRGKGKKKDDKKKRPPRTVCHTGTYHELASGLIKFRKGTIPCR
jgi:hypothetical protein